MIGSPRTPLVDGVLEVRPHAMDEAWWKVVVDGAEVASLVLEQVTGRSGTAVLVWEAPSGSDTIDLEPDAAVTALRLLVDHALTQGSWRRVETYVSQATPVGVREVSRAGLRKEGVIRGQHGDAVLMARLAGDPDIGSGEQFRATLNAGLPRTRAIAQGLVRNSDGAVLLCELTYKSLWDLPGGIVDPWEPPAETVVREVREELQISARVRSLPTVSWLPPWRGWDDALLFLFELEVDRAQLERAVLQPREIRAVHWVAPEAVDARVAPYTARLIRHACAQVDQGNGPEYLEDGYRVKW